MPRYSTLLAFQHASRLLGSVTEATSRMHHAGDLVSQLRRASISVAANIAEGAERGSDRDFVRFLRIADGSNAEVHALISIACIAGLIDRADADRIRDQAAETGRLIGGLIRRCASGG